MVETLKKLPSKFPTPDDFTWLPQYVLDRAKRREPRKSQRPELVNVYCQQYYEMLFSTPTLTTEQLEPMIDVNLSGLIYLETEDGQRHFPQLPVQSGA